MTWEADYTVVAGEEFPYSTSQVNRAGDRLRRASERGEAPTSSDLELLNVLRGFHRHAGGLIRMKLVKDIHESAGIDPEDMPVTARPLKTREAIIAKLVRERTRLATMQDIAGARIVVPNLRMQAAMREALLLSLGPYEPRVVKDLVLEADHLGYRAIHLVVTVQDRHVEIQLRTTWQDAWAQTVEQLDGMNGTDLKHGNGPPTQLGLILELSEAVLAAEHGDRSKLTTILGKLQSGAHQ